MIFDELFKDAIQFIQRLIAPCRAKLHQQDVSGTVERELHSSLYSERHRIESVDKYAMTQISPEVFHQKLFENSQYLQIAIARAIANWTSDGGCPLRMTDQCPRLLALLAGESAILCIKCPLKPETLS